MSDLKKGIIPQSAGWNKKPVKNISTGIVYESAAEAGGKTEAHKDAISRCCKGRQLTSGGCKWEYV